MNRNFTLLLFFALFAFTTACAGPQAVGVRDSFRDANVDQITVVRFYSTSSFGLTPEALDERMLSYEEATIAWLTNAGVKVHSPEDLTQRLEERALLQTYQDGVALERPLAELFEPGSEQAPLESTTLKAIASQGGFPSSALFFAEVVYQTTGTCEGNAKEFNSRAVILPPVDGAEPPTPCVVSHLEAKLVDATSGATMWHNRMLVEQWFKLDEDGAVIRQTIVRAVELTLDGPQGVSPLLGRASASR